MSKESVDLGGLLYAFRRTGAVLGLLCLTRGEASALNSTCARLEAIRPWELQLAARGSGPPTGVTGAITGTDVVIGCSFGSGPLAFTIAGAREATAQP